MQSWFWIIAAAGLAEAAFFFEVLFILGVFLLLGGLVFYTWWKKSWIGMVYSLLVCAILGALMEPWIAFGPHEEMDITSPDYDPDMEYWVGVWRFLSGIWLVAAAVTLIASGRTFRGLWEQRGKADFDNQVEESHLDRPPQ